MSIYMSIEHLEDIVENDGRISYDIISKQNKRHLRQDGF